MPIFLYKTASQCLDVKVDRIGVFTGLGCLKTVEIEFPLLIILQKKKKKKKKRRRNINIDVGYREKKCKALHTDISFCTITKPTSGETEDGGGSTVGAGLSGAEGQREMVMVVATQKWSVTSECVCGLRTVSVLGPPGRKA
ncbi:hypothetical protein FEM48_Zijuj07G0142100 [Ziziphus jujuba var. spinosa]|uniref:Uncharacterized protein n=1 Tax=Ziziphus jujuba var. spinosa TaxID=714518 RepID=A0A978V537_ZIZJJ|nr:hypothetical protein FEM48_Zijuj07G0142100 [Ziziphus jujuba var. spinosa]